MDKEMLQCTAYLVPGKTGESDAVKIRTLLTYEVLVTFYYVTCGILGHCPVYSFAQNFFCT